MGCVPWGPGSAFDLLEVPWAMCRRDMWELSGHARPVFKNFYEFLKVRGGAGSRCAFEAFSTSEEQERRCVAFACAALTGE